MFFFTSRSISLSFFFRSIDTNQSDFERISTQGTSEVLRSTVHSSPIAFTCSSLVMDQNHELSNSDVNIKAPMGVTKRDQGKSSNKCEYTSSHTGNLRTHLKTHSGEKSNKCNQCDYVSSQAGHFRTHLKTHNGEKSNKCNQCGYAFFEAGHLREHLKTYSGKKVHPVWLCILLCRHFE